MSDFIEDYIEAVVAIKVVVCILGNVNSLTALVSRDIMCLFLDQFSGYCYVI